MDIYIFYVFFCSGFLVYVLSLSVQIKPLQKLVANTIEPLPKELFATGEAPSFKWKQN